MADRIVEVASSNEASVPADTRRIDARGKYLIPGLFDAHAHTWYAGIDHRRLFIANGVTAIRDPAAPWEHLRRIHQWRREMAAGDSVGPRIWATGQPIVGPGSAHPWPIRVADADEARHAVRRLKGEGADFVKILNHLPPDAFRAVMEEARKAELPVVGHIPRELTARDIAESGVAAVEHVSVGGLMLASSSQEAAAREALLGGEPYFAILPDLLASFDPVQAKGVYDRFHRHEVTMVPTIVFFEALSETAEGEPAAIRNDWMRYLPPAYSAEWSPQLRAGSSELLHDNFERGMEGLRAMKAAGVGVLAGSDAIKPYLVPGFSLHRELALMVEAGFSEMEAIHSATRAPALFLGQADLGMIAEGMLADLVLLDGDPLEDISNTTRIRAVVAAGRIHQRRDLDRLLLDVERAAAAWEGKASTFP